MRGSGQPKKGDRLLLPERPLGCFAQKVTGTFCLKGPLVRTKGACHLFSGEADRITLPVIPAVDLRDTHSIDGPNAAKQAVPGAFRCPWFT